MQENKKVYILLRRIAKKDSFHLIKKNIFSYNSFPAGYHGRSGFSFILLLTWILIWLWIKKAHRRLGFLPYLIN